MSTAVRLISTSAASPASAGLLMLGTPRRSETPIYDPPGSAFGLRSAVANDVDPRGFTPSHTRFTSGDVDQARRMPAGNPGVTGQAIAAGGDRIALWTHPSEVHERFFPGGRTPQAVGDLFSGEYAGKLPDVMAAPLEIDKA